VIIAGHTKESLPTQDLHGPLLVTKATPLTIEEDSDPIPLLQNHLILARVRVTKNAPPNTTRRKVKKQDRFLEKVAQRWEKDARNLKKFKKAQEYPQLDQLGNRVC
jgi:hypothetical protein